MEYAALVLVALAAVLGYRFVWRRARGRHTPTHCRVEELQPGWVELRGIVRAAPSLRSPLSGREVVGYSVEVEEERGVTAWDPVIDVCRVSDFELEDESGRVSVRASRSDVELDLKDRRGRGGPFRALPKRVVRLLHRHQRPVAGVLFARAFRWREHLLEDGQRVRLRGWVGEDEGEQFAGDGLLGGYRTVGRRYVVMGRGERPVQLVPDE